MTYEYVTYNEEVWEKNIMVKTPKPYTTVWQWKCKVNVTYLYSTVYGYLCIVNFVQLLISACIPVSSLFKCSFWYHNMPLLLISSAQLVTISEFHTRIKHSFTEYFWTLVFQNDWPKNVNAKREDIYMSLGKNVGYKKPYRWSNCSWDRYFTIDSIQGYGYMVQG